MGMSSPEHLLYPKNVALPGLVSKQSNRQMCSECGMQETDQSACLQRVQNECQYRGAGKGLGGHLHIRPAMGDVCLISTV